MSINVLVIDDHALFRQGISRLIQSEPDLVVVGEGSSVADGDTLVATTHADVLLVDVSLPDGSGLNLARATRDRSQTIGIVVLTRHNDDDTLLGALEAGASALVLKVASPAEVLNAVRGAAAAPGAFSANGLAAAMHRREVARAARTHLTAQEDEVLQHLLAGESVPEVAQLLLMSESAVKAHIGHAYDKLGANNRTATIMATRHHRVVTQHESSSMRVPGHSRQPDPR
jgi:DNA-binding NarL/FixJ family response regulator